MKSGIKRSLYLLFSVVFLITIFATPASAIGFGAITQVKEGVTVKPDRNSPTGFTATFVYKNAEAKTVQFKGMFEFAKAGEQCGSENTYGPEEWTKDMFPLDSVSGKVFLRTMTKVKGTDYWKISLPLPSGGYPYSYIVDGEVTKDIQDPANMPIENPDKNCGQQLFSMAYIPFDNQKQVIDYSYVLPKNGAKKGTISFVKYPTNGLMKDADGNDKPQPLAIYLPFGYDANRTKPYKVIYLSHGIGGNESDWFDTASAGNIMDNLIAEKKTEPAIVVTMDNTSINRFDVSKVTKNVMENIIPYMESHYNVSKNSKDRAFAGLSMGGMITNGIYYSHPTDFGYFGIWSAPFPPDWFGINSSASSADNLRKPTLFLGVGCYDSMAFGNYTTLKGTLDSLDVKYTYNEVKGAHDWFTWSQLFYKFTTDILWK